MNNQTIKSIFQKYLVVSHSSHQRVRSMEGLRGYAVFLVFLVHYSGLIRPWLDPATFSYTASLFLQYVGNIGVDLFYVLSGYLIYGSLISKPFIFHKYMFKRIKRIYPVFLSVFFIYLILSLIVPSENKLPSGVMESSKYIFYNILLLPGIFKIEPIISVSWSLSYEMAFYITIPILINLFSLQEKSNKFRIYFFISLFALGIFLNEFWDNHLRLLMFVVGIILYETYEIKERRLLDILGIISLVLSLIGFFALRNYPAVYKTILLAILFYIKCYAAFSMNGLTNSFFSWSPARFLGNISYSYFLIHGLVIKGIIYFMIVILPPEKDWNVTFWVFMTPVFLVTLIFSMILFETIEKKYSIS